MSVKSPTVLDFSMNRDIWERWFGSGFNKGYLMFTTVQILSIFLLVGWYCVTYQRQHARVVQLRNAIKTPTKTWSTKCNYSSRIVVEPLSEKQVMLALITRANCDLTIRKLPGTTVNSPQDLANELSEIYQNVMMPSASSIPIAVSLLRLRSLMRGYDQLEERSQIAQVCKDIVSDTRFYSNDESIIEFLKDVAFFYGSDLEQLTAMAIPSLISSYSEAQCEATVLMLTAYARNPVTIAEILRFIATKLRHEYSQLCFKALLLICLKDTGLTEAHHVQVRHILDQNMNRHTQPCSFIYWKYQKLYPLQAATLQDTLSSSKNALLLENEQRQLNSYRMFA